MKRGKLARCDGWGSGGAVLVLLQILLLLQLLLVSIGEVLQPRRDRTCRCSPVHAGRGAVNGSEEVCLPHGLRRRASVDAEGRCTVTPWWR